MSAGRRIVITGATSGLGRATALALGREGADLILLSRNARAGKSVVQEIKRRGGRAHAEFVRVDLSSLAEVRAAADHITARWNTVDVLINNAGARFDTFAATRDGRERTFATNHLGHFLLTCLLLDRLLAAPGARVITVASSAHAAADARDQWESGAVNYDRRATYAKSKLANIVFTAGLARRLGGTNVSAFAVDPGTPATGFARNNGLVPWLKHIAFHAVKRQLVTARTAAAGIVRLATDNSVHCASGSYVRDGHPANPAPAARDPEAATQLWRLSVELSGLDASLGPSWRWVQP